MYLTIWQGHAIVTKTLEYTGRSTTKVKNIMTEEMQNIVEPVIQSELEVTEAVIETAPTNTIKFEELRVGMEFSGRVEKVELYGAWVNIGLDRPAMLHISQMGQSEIRNVQDVVTVGQELTVYVLKVDGTSKRVALSTEKPVAQPLGDIHKGQEIVGKVVRIESYGVFVDIGAERPAMIHVSELATGYVSAPSEVVSIDQEVRARVIKVDKKKRQIDMSIKAIEQDEVNAATSQQEDDDIPTAMELALRRAMDTNGGASQDRGTTGKQLNNSRKRRRELNDILSRTLTGDKN